MGIIAQSNFTQTNIDSVFLPNGSVMRQIVANSLGASPAFRFEKTVSTEPGTAGWSPIIAVDQQESGVYLRVVDWVAGQGIKPIVPENNYIGEAGLVAIEYAINIKGLQGIKGDKGDKGDTGDTGANADDVVDINIADENLVFMFASGGSKSVPFSVQKGDNGWSPILGTEEVSGKMYVKFIDWTGGEGTKPDPPAELYLGPSGFTNVGSATDIKGNIGPKGDTGLKGDKGDTGPQGPAGPAGTIAVTGLASGADFNTLDTTREYFTEDLALLTNAPEGHPGPCFISIRVFGDHIQQSITSGSAGRIWTRASTDGGLNWTTWKLI